MEKEYNISINITPKAFEGLARQGMLCHQGICELCDDALAATLPNEKARVCVALAPDADKNHLNIAVADWGCGMELAALTNALQLGSAPLSNDRLNEHGYGLNNALACLSGGTGDWCIYTRSQPGPYFKVSGPFDLNMTVKMTDTIDLPEGLNLQWPDPSTVIHVRVPMAIARTLQRQGNRKLSDLVTLRMWLIEHLGVAYRGYLELGPVTLEPSAKIAVTVGQSSLLVPPIPVPMMMGRTEKLEVELGGQVVPVTYVHGMFGMAWTEMDEESYLDLLSDEYAVARYLHLKRFSPYEPALLKRRVLMVQNSTRESQNFSISSHYAISARWRKKHDDKNH